MLWSSEIERFPTAISHYQEPAQWGMIPFYLLDGDEDKPVEGLPTLPDGRVIGLPSGFDIVSANREIGKAASRHAQYKRELVAECRWYRFWNRSPFCPPPT